MLTTEPTAYNIPLKRNLREIQDKSMKNGKPFQIEAQINGAGALPH